MLLESLKVCEGQRVWFNPGTHYSLEWVDPMELSQSSSRTAFGTEPSDLVPALTSYGVWFPISSKGEGGVV